MWRRVDDNGVDGLVEGSEHRRRELRSVKTLIRSVKRVLVRYVPMAIAESTMNASEGVIFVAKAVLSWWFGGYRINQSRQLKSERTSIVIKTGVYVLLDTRRFGTVHGPTIHRYARS